VKEYVVQTMKAAQAFIDNDMKAADEEKTRRVLAEFEIKIAYFQHERLIHLMVTLFFALFLLLLGITVVIRHTGIGTNHFVASLVLAKVFRHSIKELLESGFHAVPERRSAKTGFQISQPSLRGISSEIGGEASGLDIIIDFVQRHVSLCLEGIVLELVGKVL
jgi:hypothetical protein